MGLFFKKGVLKFLVKILVKNTCQVTAPDAFTFPEEILKRKISLFWVLAVSKEIKNESVVINIIPLI